MAFLRLLFLPGYFAYAELLATLNACSMRALGMEPKAQCSGRRRACTCYGLSLGRRLPWVNILTLWPSFPVFILRNHAPPARSVTSPNSILLIRKKDTMLCVTFRECTVCC